MWSPYSHDYIPFHVQHFRVTVRSIKLHANCGRCICKRGLSLCSLGTEMRMTKMVMIWWIIQECQLKMRWVLFLVRCAVELPCLLVWPSLVCLKKFVFALWICYKFRINNRDHHATGELMYVYLSFRPQLAVWRRCWSNSWRLWWHTLIPQGVWSVNCSRNCLPKW